VILSSDGLFESSLMGTKDGYLNFALALLQFVADGSQPTEPTEIERLNDEPAYWSDNFKNALNQLPGGHAYIVGSYLFDDHQSFLRALEKEVDPTLSNGAELRNDPAFREP
jgi:hypothetical protein